VRTPIVEATPLFVRGIGEVTDIVEKEMYSFVDSMNGDALTLRPENTAGVVRAVIEHALLRDGGRRLFYIGPMFRHERPQRGRYRQFHQVGVEALGYAGPDVDAEVILMARALWRDLGLADVRLEINSLGQSDERAAYRAALVNYFEHHAGELDAEAQRRLDTNPLRILDTKNPAMQSVVEAAPKMIDYLGTASREHFDAVRAALDAAGQAYRINARLVRGLDYYNLTVSEWVTDRLGAQGTVCGGGRYDGLVELIGGKPAPACGFAMGVERLIALMRDGGARDAAEPLDVYLVHQGETADRFAFAVAERLRGHGLSVLQHAGGGSFKSQMKRADASGAMVAVIVGDDEAAAGEASVKALREERPQVRAALDALPAAVSDILYGERID
jgi:histidyl-tRNA synthetase